MSGQLAFYVDTSACSGCKTCQIACQDKNNLAADVLFRHVYQYGGGQWTEKDGIYVPDGVFRYFISYACNHCGAPACLAACPVSAIVKDPDSGIVTIDPALCIACGSCKSACPYAIPVLDDTVSAFRKCDFCRDYVADSKNPACVDACPQRAIGFGVIDSLQGTYPGTTDALEPLPVASTAPSLLLKAHVNAQLSGSGTGRVLNLPDEL
jgi:anaerobic dimethyl sulfoxide reductase subunit B (iron-sulfur subunit)